MSGRISRRFVSYFSATVNHDRRDQVSLLLPPIYIDRFHTFVFFLSLSSFFAFLSSSVFLLIAIYISLALTQIRISIYAYIWKRKERKKKKMKRNRVKTIPCSISFHLFYFRLSFFFLVITRSLK